MINIKNSIVMIFILVQVFCDNNMSQKNGEAASEQVYEAAS